MINDVKPIALYKSDFAFSAKQLSEICELQNNANKNMFGENWEEVSVKELPYYRASLVESVEAISEMGYKWWKKEECDYNHLKMELIDILHFVISDELRNCNGSIEQVVNRHLDPRKAIVIYPIGGYHDVVSFSGPGFEMDPSNPTASKVTDIKAIHFNDLCEQLIFKSLAQGASNLDNLILLFDNLSISPTEVYLKYVAKNTLNLFRNSNGQKEGHYYRMWDGVEDNEVLSNFIISNPESDSSSIYAFLCEKYGTSKLEHMTHKI